MAKYEHIITLEGERISIIHTRMLVEGFWLNVFHELTFGADSLYWIPSHAIKYIRKIKDDSRTEATQ